MIRIARYSNAQDNIPRVEDLEWSQLAQMLSTHRRSRCNPLPCARTCAGKNGEAWSPVDIAERRLNQNVRAVTVAVFDLDHVTEATVEGVLNHLDVSGYSWVVHSTHSNRWPDEACLRLVLPLSRPVAPREWAAVRAAAARHLQLPPPVEVVREVDGKPRKVVIGTDPSTKDLSRIYYLPDAPEGTEPLAARGEGRPLDVDALLAFSRTGFSAAAPAAATEMGPVPTDLHELAELLRQHAKPENRALVGRVLRGEPFAPLGQQDTTLQALMSTCAFCLPNDTPDEVIVHLLRPSFTATNWQDGTEHLITEALKKLHRARERKIARDTQRAEENRRLWEKIGRKAPAAVPAPSDEGEEDPVAWMGQLITKDGRRLAESDAEVLKLKNCLVNAVHVVEHDPAWNGRLRFNEVTKDAEFIDPVTSQVRPLKDGIEINVAFEIGNGPFGQLGLMPEPGTVRDALFLVISNHGYDPLRDYLTGLVWDGKHRIDDFLATYFGAEGDARYLRAVGSKWLISAVARALSPGDKVDTLLILEGLQGIGKSTAFRILGGPWFTDASIDINNKDSWALASTNWIIEFAELKDVKRADAETLKGFLSRNEDTFRPPYGRKSSKFPRRCVFVGTTNADDYLRFDPSGYRRYWPVKCAQVDLEALRRDAPQLWAEAVVRYEKRTGEYDWWLTPEEEELNRAQTSIRAELPGGPDELILEWLLRQPPQRRTGLATDQVARDALQIEVARIDTGTRVNVGRAMKRLGFKRKQRLVAGVVTWVYEAPSGLLSHPQTKPGGQPSPIAPVITGESQGK